MTPLKIKLCATENSGTDWDTFVDMIRNWDWIEVDLLGEEETYWVFDANVLMNTDLGFLYSKILGEPIYTNIKTWEVHKSLVRVKAPLDIVKERLQ